MKTHKLLTVGVISTLLLTGCGKTVQTIDNSFESYNEKHAVTDMQTLEEQAVSNGNAQLALKFIEDLNIDVEECTFNFDTDEVNLIYNSDDLSVNLSFEKGKLYECTVIGEYIPNEVNETQKGIVNYFMGYGAFETLFADGKDTEETLGSFISTIDGANSATMKCYDTTLEVFIYNY